MAGNLGTQQRAEAAEQKVKLKRGTDRRAQEGAEVSRAALGGTLGTDSAGACCSLAFCIPPFC